MPHTDRRAGNAYRARYYKRRTQAGLCRTCGKKPRVTAHMCRDCQDGENKRVLKSKHENRDQHNARVREVTAMRRAEVFKHYGDKCQCCDEAEPMFLTLDHKNGGGRHDARFKSSSGTRLTAAQFYNKVIKLGFPDDLQLLCFNCNCGKHRNGGSCPHERLKREWNEYPKAKAVAAA